MPARKARSTARPKTLKWVRPPRQDRSRDTHARIVAAAERLLASGHAWAEITVEKLVSAADASVGAFYHRFKDKNALLHVLQIELCAQGSMTVENGRALGTRDMPLHTLTRAFVALAVRSYRDQWGLRRALLVEMCTETVFRERTIELTKQTCAAMAEVLVPRVRRKDADRIATVVDVCHRLIYSTLDQRLLYDQLSPTGRELTDEQLTEELSLACLAYIERSLPLRA